LSGFRGFQHVNYDPALALLNDFLGSASTQVVMRRAEPSIAIIIAESKRTLEQPKHFESDRDFTSEVVVFHP
jgi:hypothetical protein